MTSSVIVPMYVYRSFSEEPECRQLSSPTRNANLFSEAENSMNANETSRHTLEQIPGLKVGCLLSNASLELSTGVVPPWAVRLPYVHPIHQLIQRGCLVSESKISKLTTLVENQSTQICDICEDNVELPPDSVSQQSAVCSLL